MEAKFLFWPCASIAPWRAGRRRDRLLRNRSPHTPSPRLQGASCDPQPPEHRRAAPLHAPAPHRLHQHCGAAAVPRTGLCRPRKIWETPGRRPVILAHHTCTVSGEDPPPAAARPRAPRARAGKVSEEFSRGTVLPVTSWHVRRRSELLAASQGRPHVAKLPAL